MVETFKPISTQDATNYLYKVFRVLGMDNLNRTWLYNLHSFQLIFASCVLQLIAFTASYVKSIRSMSIPTLLSSMQVAVNIYSIALKVIVVYFCMPKLRKTGPIINELDKQISDKEERRVAKQMIKFCRGLVIVYLTCNLTYAAIAVFAAVWNGHPPFGIYIPFCNWQDSNTKMIVATLLEIYLINISCVQNVGLDVYPLTFIYMARMHMKILCIRVEKLGIDSGISSEDNVRNLVNCIKTHKKIMKLIETVRPIIAKTIFIQLVVSAAIMVFPIINLMMFANSFFSAFGSIVFLLALTLETLPMCFTMNVLLEEINNLPTAIFHSQWVNQNKTFRRLMVVFMQNAQKFNNIMAGNILSIEVSTFIALIAFTASYVKSIRSMSIPTLLTSMQVAINIYTVALKVIVVFFYMSKLRETAPILDELDKKIYDKEERIVAEKMIRFCRGLIVLYMVSYLAYSAIEFFAAVWNGHPPFGIYIPFCHWEDSKTKMFVASLLEYYLLNIACIQDVGLDVYPITFIYMARTHMKILCIRVEKLGINSGLSKEENVRSLVDCIETHKKILELIETVRPIIVKTIFIQFVVSAAIMGIPIINIMMFADSLSSAFGSIVFMLAVTLETLPMCFTMNVLMDEINNLPTAIFHSQWVDQNKKFRHLIVVFMQNAQKFQNIMAGNILPIEVATFISIAKMAFSIYAVVDKMAERRSAHAILETK